MIVTLLTDFGLSDPFVGIMKGVILSRAPDVRIVDLTHGIPPQDVIAGSFWLAESWRWFPRGTVHVAVVDPGVGTARTPVALEVEGHVFVGPDNGLFGALPAPAAVHGIDTSRFGRLSRTFHGRDIFAPVAANLASGALALADVGPARPGVAPSPIPLPRDAAGGLEGAVVVVDRFGNLITNLRSAHVTPGSVLQLGERTFRVVGTYGEARPGEVVALVNAFDCLEIAVRDGNAADTLGVTTGTPVLLARGGSR